jgi:TRAP-type C4-dicarboxylate transport system permease small subunit
MVAVVYLGLAYTQKKREHVSLSLLTDALPVRWGMTLRLAGQFIIIALVGWIIWRTGLAALRSFTINEVRFGLLQIPMWPARAAIPIGFIAFLLQSLLDIPERLWAVKTGHLRADFSPKVVS